MAEANPQGATPEDATARILSIIEPQLKRERGEEVPHARPLGGPRRSQVDEGRSHRLRQGCLYLWSLSMWVTDARPRLRRLVCACAFNR